MRHLDFCNRYLSLCRLNISREYQLTKNNDLTCSKQLLYCCLYEWKVRLLEGSLKAVRGFYYTVRDIVLAFLFTDTNKKDIKLLKDYYGHILWPLQAKELLFQQANEEILLIMLKNQPLYLLKKVFTIIFLSLEFRNY